MITECKVLSKHKIKIKLSSHKVQILSNNYN